MGRLTLSVTIAVTTLTIGTPIWASPPIETEPVCQRWTGSSNGNDPSVRLQVELCAGENNELTGYLRWNSSRSGWNRRRLEGRWSPDGSSLTMRDVEVVDSHPNSGWRFCEIDQYALRRVRPDRLEGTYVSRSCSDRATVWLNLVTTPRTAGGGVSPAETDRPSPPSPRPPSEASRERPGDVPTEPPPPEPPNREERERSGCACQSAGGQSAGLNVLAPIVGFFVAFLILRRPREGS